VVQDTNELEKKYPRHLTPAGYVPNIYYPKKFPPVAITVIERFRKLPNPNYNSLSPDFLILLHAALNLYTAFSCPDTPEIQEIKQRCSSVLSTFKEHLPQISPTN